MNNTPTDFLGVPFTRGTFVAAGGAGNTKAEYGMILYFVLEVEPKLKLVRLASSYPTSDSQKTEVRMTKSTPQNPNKYVNVSPPKYVVDLFQRAVDEVLTQKDKNLIGRWVHGAEHQTNLFK